VHDSLTTIAENKMSERWDTAAASTNEAGCDGKLKAQMEWIQRMLEDRTAKAPRDEEMYFKIIEGRIVRVNFYRKMAAVDDPPVRTQTITHVCLPDTVDPRGPKGK
jgi:hypothetical protein